MRPLSSPRRSLRNPCIALTVPFVGYVIWLSIWFFAPPNPIWAFCLLVCAAAAGAFAWYLARGGGISVLHWLEDHSIAVTRTTIFLFAATSIVLNVFQAEYFALGARAQDTAYNNQILWNTLHGHFLNGNLNQESLYNPPVTNELALHVSPVLLLVLLPIYSLFPHFLTLLLVRDIALSAAAWPLYLIVRDRMGGGAATAASILYLLNPVVVSQVFQEFSLLQIAPFPFFLASRAFLHGKLGKFIFWIALTIATREDASIAAAGFGLWALLLRRGIRWWGAGLSIPVFWWLLATMVVQPAFGRHGNSSLDLALTGGNHNPFVIYFTLAYKSLLILRTGGTTSLEYLYHLLRPFAFLPLFGVEGVLAVPSLLANIFLLNAYPHAGTGDPTSRFALLPSCALIVASVIGFARIGKRYSLDLTVVGIIAFLLMPSVMLIQGAKDAIQLRLILYNFKIPNDPSALRQALRLIPANSPVASPEYVLPMLSSRHLVYDITSLQRYPAARPDYLLYDRNVDRVTVNPDVRRRYVDLLQTLLHSGEYERIWEEKDYLLFRRMANTKSDLSKKLPSGDPAHTYPASTLPQSS